MAQKILVVDDDRINVALVKFALAEKGYDVLIAHDGQEALNILKQQSADCIVLDIMMPNMNGYEFINELKTTQGLHRTQVIMLTANETLGEIFRLEGVRDYFVKPVKLPELMQKIQQLVGPPTDD